MCTHWKGAACELSVSETSTRRLFTSIGSYPYRIQDGKIQTTILIGPYLVEDDNQNPPTVNPQRNLLYLLSEIYKTLAAHDIYAMASTRWGNEPSPAYSLNLLRQPVDYIE